MKLQNTIGTAEIDQHSARLMAWQPATFTSLIWSSAQNQSQSRVGGVEPLIRIPSHILQTHSGSQQTGRSLPVTLDWVEEHTDKFTSGWSVGFRGVTRTDSAHQLEVSLDYNISHDLLISLTVTSLETQPFLLDQAIQLSYSAGDIKDVTISGVQGHPYRDLNTDKGARPLLTDAHFVTATNIQFHDISTFEIIDPRKHREACFDVHGARTVTFWTPWNSRSSEAAPEITRDWQHYLRICAGNTGRFATLLHPGESHTVSMTTELRSMV